MIQEPNNDTSTKHTYKNQRMKHKLNNDKVLTLIQELTINMRIEQWYKMYTMIRELINHTQELNNDKN